MTTTCKVNAIVYPRLFPPSNIDIVQGKISLCAASPRKRRKSSLHVAWYTAYSRTETIPLQIAHALTSSEAKVREWE